MSLSGKPTVWQVSGGPANRDYADVFLKYGVALIGPGDTGLWNPELKDEECEGHYVRHFATEVKTGDMILLRKGISTIRALGIVASEYLHLPQFDDVNGWDLQHARRVRWAELPGSYDFETLVFVASAPRVSRVGSPEVIDYALRFISSPPIYWQTAPLPPLPDESKPLDEPPSWLRDLFGLAHDLTPLYWNRSRFGDHPSEDELIVHFLIPLLRSLGWPPELIAVQWRYIDVGLFRSLPRTPETCHLIIESKRFGEGIDGALAQAQAYLTALGIARDILVTDGIRYRLYDASLNFVPVAYANLTHLKQPALELFARLKRP